MSTRLLNGSMFIHMVSAGAQNLNANRTLVNDLNVFPVPDGDTGDNMFMTIDFGAHAASEAEENALGDVSSRIAHGMLLGARGNSGVILSRIFAGIARHLTGLPDADVRTLGDAFAVGVEEAYRAVSNPVEGTILTVYRDAVEYANGKIGETETLDAYFENFLSELRRSLDRTPDLLPVLRDAGVVDSGGAGFVYIAEGMRDALAGKTVTPTERSTDGAPKALDLSKFTADSVLEYGYCTEFLLRLQNAKGGAEAFDLQRFIAFLEQVGNSVVAFAEDTIVKAHVHTMTPGVVLNECQKYGEFLTLKIENMTLQHEENTVSERFVPKRQKVHKKYGIISVAAGEGIRETFLSLGTDVVVNGGQTMNPSAEDILRAIKEINADTIFIFPNNKNIQLTALQAASLAEGVDVRVIPSRTIGEGYAAISMFDDTAPDADTIAETFREVIEGVVTGTVSRACRDTDMNGVSVRDGDYIGYCDGVIRVDDPSRETATLALAEKLDAGKYDILLLICGAGAPADECDRVYAALSSAYRRTEVIMINGGQPSQDYILVLE